MNPILKKLGYDEKARVVILHADDIGMCQASVDAYADLLEFGVMSSAATMVPCPWFPAAAEYFRSQSGNPNFDMGVHATLNSEWGTFRWGPISTRDTASGLLDEHGYFYSRSEPTGERANPDAVEKELTAQVERALAAGFDVTHMDTHMLTAFEPRLMAAYLRVAEKFGLPAFALHPDHEWMSETTPKVRKMLLDAQERGMALFDHFDALSLDDPNNRLQEMKRALYDAPMGLSAIVFHPVRDSAEVRGMGKDWACRVADHDLFVNEALRQTIADAGVQVIGYRILRDTMRSQTNLRLRNA